MLIILGLFVVVIVVIAILFKLVKGQRTAFTAGLTSHHHYGNISAVLFDLYQLEQLDESSLKLLKTYPQMILTAALNRYIDLLESDLHKAQDALSKAHNGEDWTMLVEQSELIEDRQAHVDLLFAKLGMAVQLANNHSI